MMNFDGKWDEMDGAFMLSASADAGLGGVQRMTTNLPKYIDGAIEVGKVINHTVIAVLTGNVFFLVEDIVTYATCAKHCKSECRRLAEQMKIARDSAAELLDKLDKNPKEVEDKSFVQALKAFAIVLEDGRALVKQHMEARYGLKIFYARRFAAEFKDIEERLDQACQRLNFAVNIRHFVDAQEWEERHHKWHEEDKLAFEQLNNSVKEALQEIRSKKQPNNAVSEQVLRNARIPHALMSDMKPFKTGRLYIANYCTADEQKRGNATKVVIKVTVAREADPNEMRIFALEVAFLQKLAPSPNIINLIGITPVRTNMALVLEYCEHGDLQSFIAKGELQGDWGKKRGISLGIAQAVAFLHEAGILHKYINSGNILLDAHIQPKITNFRKSRWNTAPTHGTIDSFEEQIRWTAPERLGDDAAKFNTACDVFSFGVVFYEIVTEKFPWKELSLDEVYKKRKIDDKELGIPPTVPTEIASIYASCTRKNPSRRLSTRAIIKQLELIRPEDLESKFDLGVDDELSEPDDSPDVMPLHRDWYLSTSDDEDDIPTSKATLDMAENYHRTRDHAKAFAEYMKVVDEFPHAAFRIAEYRLFGKGVKVNMEEAVKYLELAVNGGDGDAMDLLGFMYLTGKGVVRDRYKAVKLFVDAVAKDVPHGMYHLGVCYFKGMGGLRRDVEEAKRLVIQAAGMGNEEAVRFGHHQKWDVGK